jgi:hypothetical protein
MTASRVTECSRPHLWDAPTFVGRGSACRGGWKRTGVPAILLVHAAGAADSELQECRKGPNDRTSRCRLDDNTTTATGVRGSPEHEPWPQFRV